MTNYYVDTQFCMTIILCLLQSCCPFFLHILSNLYNSMLSLKQKKLSEMSKYWIFMYYDASCCKLVILLRFGLFYALRYPSANHIIVLSIMGKLSNIYALLLIHEAKSMNLVTFSWAWSCLNSMYDDVNLVAYLSKTNLNYMLLCQLFRIHVILV